MASFPNMAWGPISVCRAHWPALPVFSPSPGRHCCSLCPAATRREKDVSLSAHNFLPPWLCIRFSGVIESNICSNRYNVYLSLSGLPASTSAAVKGGQGGQEKGGQATFLHTSHSCSFLGSFLPAKFISLPPLLHWKLHEGHIGVLTCLFIPKCSANALP